MNGEIIILYILYIVMFFSLLVLLYSFGIILWDKIFEPTINKIKDYKMKWKCEDCDYESNSFWGAIFHHIKMWWTKLSFHWMVKNEL